MTFLLLLGAGIVVLDVVLARPESRRAEPLDLTPLVERKQGRQEPRS